jgi:hypothetical protein
MMKLFHVRTNSSMSTPLDRSNCYFLARTNGQSSLVQLIDLESFSVLIDNNQAMYNLSAYFYCQGYQYINVSIISTFLTYNGISNEQDSSNLFKTK